VSLSDSLRTRHWAGGTLLRSMSPEPSLNGWLSS
jgi:hypothetical protein